MRIFLSAIILIGMMTACNHAPEKPVEQKFSLTDSMMAKISFAKASTEPVKNELRLYGKVSVDNNKMAQVFPIVGGNVTKVNVHHGDYVKQGQVLAVIRSSEVAGYEKEKLDAVNDVAVAEKNLQVAQDLFSGKLNSEKDLVAAQKELEKAKAAEKRINEVYGIYNLKGSYYNVTAPISGFIIEKTVNENMLLNSTNLNNLFTIAQIDEVWVVANVNESDISLVSQGMDATVNTIAYPDTSFRGNVTRIYNILDPESKAMKIRIRIPNATLLLKPEMSATVSLHYSEPKQMVAIPSSAVIFDKSKYWVMVFHDKAHIDTRQIDIYRQTGGVTYLRGGLEANEQVITNGQMLVYDALND